MFPHTKSYELHLDAREAYQRWPPPQSDMTCLKETLILATNLYSKYSISVTLWLKCLGLLRFVFFYSKNVK